MVIKIGGMPFYPIFLCDDHKASALKLLAQTFKIELVDDTDGNLTISDGGTHNIGDLTDFLTAIKNSDLWIVETFRIKDRDVPTIAFIHKEYKNAHRN